MADYLVTDTELTSIADAIRAKGGTSADLEFPTEFVQAINDIPTGGGGESWIKGDGKTYLHINIYDDFFLPVKLLFQQSVSGGNTIDWGDGTSTTPSGTSRQQIAHTYEQVGEYVITITNTNGYFNFGNSSSIGGYIFVSGGESSWNSRQMYCSILRKAELGNGWRSSGRAFLGCRNLTDVYISVPLVGNTLHNSIFEDCNSLKKVYGINGWQTAVTSIGNRAFLSCAFDEVIQLPNVTVLPQNFMSANNGGINTLGVVNIWKGIETISSNAFANQLNIAKVVIPSTVTSIETQAFYNCLGIKELHMIPTVPPSLANANAIPNAGVVNLTIYVPYSSDHSILEAYQSATNWSTYASKMVEESE